MNDKGVLVERLESIHRDIALILVDVQNSDKEAVYSHYRLQELDSALHGMDWVLRDLTELRDATKGALERYKKYTQKIGA